MTKFLGESGSKKLIDLVKAKTVQDPNYVHTDNNYTNEEKTKLAGIETGANKTIVEREWKKYSYNPVASLLLQKKFAEVDKDKISLLNIKGNKFNSKSGDEIILELDEQASHSSHLRGIFENDSDYQENKAYGYVLSNKGVSFINKSFNRIKIVVQTPGWVRIGIVRGIGSEENPNERTGIGICSSSPKTYDLEEEYPAIEYSGETDSSADGTVHTLLKKWLVFQYVATPGVHTFDFPETKIYSPYEYIFIENKAGIHGYALNITGAAKIEKGLEVPANTQLTGTHFYQGHLTKTDFKNKGWASSNNLLSASARFSFKDSRDSAGRFYTLDCDGGERENLSKENSSTARLNIGIYKRTDSSEFIMQPMSENVTSMSTNLTNISTEVITGLWTYDIDTFNKFFEKDLEIFAFDLFVVKPGDFTVYTVQDSDPANARVVDVMTLKLRAMGPQRVHLNHPIRLKFGQFLVFGGPTEAAFYEKDKTKVFDSSTNKFKSGYSDTAMFAFGTLSLPDSYSIGDKTNSEDGATNQVPYDTVTEKWADHKFSKLHGVSWDAENRTLNLSSYYLATNKDTYLNIGIVARKAKISKIEDLNVSVTGDSISTYRGTISKPEDFVENTNQAGANAIFYPDSGKGLVVSQDHTWWGKVIKDNRARLLRNDAWSGSTVTGAPSSTSSPACSSEIRAKQLMNNRLPHLPTSEGKIAHPFGDPDIILCMIGTNDFSSGRELGNYKTDPTDTNTIIGAFQTMIKNHRKLYKFAKLIYFIIPRGDNYLIPASRSDGLNIAQMAEAMEYAAKMMGAYFVPYNRFHLLGNNENVRNTMWTPTGQSWVHPRVSQVYYQHSDFLHPNHIGHAIIANEITNFIEETL